MWSTKIQRPIVRYFYQRGTKRKSCDEQAGEKENSMEGNFGPSFSSFHPSHSHELDPMCVCRGNCLSSFSSHFLSSKEWLVKETFSPKITVLFTDILSRGRRRTFCGQKRWERQKGRVRKIEGKGEGRKGWESGWSEKILQDVLSVRTRNWLLIPQILLSRFLSPNLSDIESVMDKHPFEWVLFAVNVHSKLWYF